MKIVVLGLGYVGMSNAVLLAQHNEVVGVDIQIERVNLVNERKSTIIDTKLSEYLAEKELINIKEKYNEIINNSSGKVIKIEEWGLLNLATRIKNYKKGFYIHFKFEGNNETLKEIEKKIKVDGSIIRHLTVKYKKLDIENEFKKFYEISTLCSNSSSF